MLQPACLLYTSFQPVAKVLARGGQGFEGDGQVDEVRPAVAASDGHAGHADLALTGDVDRQVGRAGDAELGLQVGAHEAGTLGGEGAQLGQLGLPQFQRFGCNPALTLGRYLRGNGRRQAVDVVGDAGRGVGGVQMGGEALGEQGAKLGVGPEFAQDQACLLYTSRCV